MSRARRGTRRMTMVLTGIATVAAVAATARPALAQTLAQTPAQTLAQTPQPLPVPPTVEQRLDEAVRLRLAGDAATAAAYLRPLAAEQSHNADVQVQLGYAELALGRLDAAEAAFRHTLALAPDYTDAQNGLALVAARRNAGVDAGAADAGTADAGAPRWRLDVDGALSTLSGGNRDWRQASVRLSHAPNPGARIGLGVEVAHRFGHTDSYGELRYDHRFADNAGGAYVFVGGTPDALFLPQWQIGVGGAARVRGGPAATVLTLDARHADYVTGAIQQLSPGVDQYLADGRAWIGLRYIALFAAGDRTLDGWSIRGDVLATDAVQLYAGYADAPDLSEGVALPTRSLFGGIAWTASPRLSLRAGVARETRRIGPDRTEFSLGTSWSF